MSRLSQIVARSREAQLRAILQAENGVKSEVTRAIKLAVRDTRNLPAGPAVILPHHQARIVREITKRLQTLSSDHAAILNHAVYKNAQVAAGREAFMQEFVGYPVDERLKPTTEKTWTLSSGRKLTQKFGRLAQQSVGAQSRASYGDNLTLQERFTRITTDAHTEMVQLVATAIDEKMPRTEFNARLTQIFNRVGSKVSRIVRTESVHTHQEAHRRSVKNPDGSLKAYVAGIKWNLSPSHKDEDECDSFASHDDGMGKGVYNPDALPSEHPNGLCFTTTAFTPEYA